jgi:uncharacterized membrane protein
MQVAYGFVFIGIIICCYFLPTIIAHQRETDNEQWVGILNLLLGWTVIGWVILLIVALIGQKKIA